MAVATWVGPPRSYTVGRPRPIQYVVVHYTAGHEGPNDAENGAAYDKVRTDGTSTHVFVDSNSVVREVWDQDQAHAARRHGNYIGLQMEICGTEQTREQWLDETSYATLRMAAKQCAEWVAAHGIPLRRLTVDEVRAAWYAPEGQRPKGFCGHVDVTHAYPEDGGEHTDPGKAFPWDVLFSLIRAELNKEEPMAWLVRDGKEPFACWLVSGQGKTGKPYAQHMTGDWNEHKAALPAVQLGSGRTLGDTGLYDTEPAAGGGSAGPTPPVTALGGTGTFTWQAAGSDQ